MICWIGGVEQIGLVSPKYEMLLLLTGCHLVRDVSSHSMFMMQNLTPVFICFTAIFTFPVPLLCRIQTSISHLTEPSYTIV